MPTVPDPASGRQEGCPLHGPSDVGCPLAGASRPPFTLDEALRRFEREASWGVCDTGHYRCRYFTWGKGPPLVFLHGLGDTARGYIPVISLLASQFRCIAYDLPSGHGDGADLRRLTHDDLVTDLFALLDHLGVRQSYVFGSSFGSTVVLAALHTAPDRIPRGILAGGFARRTLAPAELLLARLGCYLPGFTRHLPGRRLMARHALGAAVEQRPELLEFFLNATADPALHAVARRVLAIHGLDLRPRLPAIPQPILLVCGECDPVVGRTCEEELLGALPRAMRVELSGCAHLPHYSHPEILAEVLRRFLTPPAEPAAAGRSRCSALP